MKPSQKFLPYCLSFLAWCYIQFVGRTSRFELIGPDYSPLIHNTPNPFIFTFWHSRLLMPLFYFRKTGIATLVSRSQDGEYITQLMLRLGLRVSRGSSSRAGMEGLLGLLHFLKRKRCVAITPDGPRGPREVISPGTIQLARLSGIPIVPVTFSCSWGKRFPSWDHFMLPYPFGMIRMVVGDPLSVPRKATKQEFEEKRLELEREMHRITLIADEIFPVQALSTDPEKIPRSERNKAADL